MRTSYDPEKPRTRSLALVLLAWAFIGGQVLLAAGSVYANLAQAKQIDKPAASWLLLSQGAAKMRVMAAQAGPEVLGHAALFLAVANTLGVAALMCALLSWSRSKHTSGKLTIAAAVTVILVNSILNLPYA
ncbi:MAG: hypothetical protein MUC88_12355 [Planctomycetes bacterium]|jgi:peptidoglycan/LPS O-acetylase OafA/YrhL|nr:hypothetical protein [Planctomycetota bacterium]